MNSEGLLQTPQDIMGEYNGCSVPQYTRYPMTRMWVNGVTGHLYAKSPFDLGAKAIDIIEKLIRNTIEKDSVIVIKSD